MEMWKKYYPHELSEWIKQLDYDLTVERTVREAVKNDGGYFPISYPTRLWSLLRFYSRNRR